MKLSPGLTSTPHVQKLTMKGKLNGCTGEGITVTSATYVAHLTTFEETTCAALTPEQAHLEGPIVIKWSPKGTGTSKGVAILNDLREGEGDFDGSIGTGPFAEDSFGGSPYGWIAMTFENGPKCGASEGKKAAKPVKKGSFTATTPELFF